MLAANRRPLESIDSVTTLLRSLVNLQNFKFSFPQLVYDDIGRLILCNRWKATEEVLRNIGKGFSHLPCLQDVTLSFGSSDGPSFNLQMEISLILASFLVSTTLPKKREML